MTPPEPKRQRRARFQGCDGGDDAERRCVARAAGSAIFKKLLSMYGACKIMSGKDLCELCYHLDGAGVEGADFSLFNVAPVNNQASARRGLMKSPRRRSLLLTWRYPLARKVGQSERITPFPLL
eukprot:5358092-Pyramimonas_sp.AAC.1